MNRTRCKNGLIIETHELGPFETNCFLLFSEDRRECWIIDAGFEPGGLIESVRSSELTPSEIILTHAHADHIAGLAEIKRAFPQAPVSIHQAESGWLTDAELNLSAGMGFPITAPQADVLLEGEETLDFCGSSWRVIHTPGHSPGGITLHCEEAGAAFVGDTLFAGSIGRFDFPTSDERALFSSIRDTLYQLPGETLVFPGHGPDTTIDRERATNPFVRAE